MLFGIFLITALLFFCRSPVANEITTIDEVLRKARISGKEKVKEE
jgi:hypothetical protein